MDNETDYVLDEEEQHILEKFNQGELRSPPEAAQEMELARQAAGNTLSKWREITLKFSEEEYNLAHARAEADGIPCPTLLSGIIHNYLSGRLVEKG